MTLLLRWIRWHFLMRTLEIRLKTQDSITLYFATLPAILTPLYVGEIVRGLVLSRRYPRARQAVVWIWFVERFADAAILGLFWLLAIGWWGGAGAVLSVLLLIFYLLWASTRSDEKRNQGTRFEYTRYSAVLLGTTLFSWILPILALWYVTDLLGSSASFSTAARAFSQGTLVGGFSGIPLGTGVTGSVAILVLRSGGIGEAVATASIAVLRAGTAWYAVTLGLAVLWLSKRRLRDLLRVGSFRDHFDAIAPEYASQIGAHVRDRLLTRKIAVMASHLSESGRPDSAFGLDLGCGQGWYACEMVAAGFDMIGVDQSAAQVERAREHAARKGVQVTFETMKGSALDFDDETFDFVYAINVLHHLIDPEERRCVLHEIVRVLKTGGTFYMHEMNTENPLFRFYLSYVFPLIRDIDEGDEQWVKPTALPEVRNAEWEEGTAYFTFLPDFLPETVLEGMTGIEARLERSRFRHLSAHYMARLTKR